MIYRIFRGRNAADSRKPARRARWMLGLATVAALLPTLANRAFADGQTFNTIALPTSSLNANLKQHYSGLYTTYASLGLTGDVTLGGVPFLVPVVTDTSGLFSGGTRILPTRAQSNFWLSAYTWGPGDVQTQTPSGLTSISMTPNLNQTPDVYFLMNSWWGRRTNNGLANGTVISAASVVFTFVDYASVTHTWTKTLTAGPANYSLYTWPAPDNDYSPSGPLNPPSNAEIRDFHDSQFKNRYSNVINRTNTVNVYRGTFLGLSDQDDPRNYRLDKVRVSIPYPYNQMKLTGLQVKDQGQWGIQRIFVGGITGQTGHCVQMNLLSTVAGAGNSYLQVYRLTNCSSYALDNPLSVLLTNLTPGVTCTNSTGTTTLESPNVPYVNPPSLGSSQLLPNQSLIVTLRFTSSSSLVGVKPFTEKILAGPGPR